MPVRIHLHQSSHITNHIPSLPSHPTPSLLPHYSLYSSSSSSTPFPIPPFSILPSGKSAPPLTGLLDSAAAQSSAWDWPVDRLESLVADELDRLLPALSAATDAVVLVTNEVGWGVVPSHRSGRVFRDLLGTVNQRVAGVCDEVHLVVAGRVLVL